MWCVVSMAEDKEPVVFTLNTARLVCARQSCHRRITGQCAIEFFGLDAHTGAADFSAYHAQCYALMKASILRSKQLKMVCAVTCLEDPKVMRDLMTQNGALEAAVNHCRRLTRVESCGIYGYGYPFTLRFGRSRGFMGPPGCTALVPLVRGLFQCLYTATFTISGVAPVEWTGGAYTRLMGPLGRVITNALSDSEFITFVSLVPYFHAGVLHIAFVAFVDDTMSLHQFEAECKTAHLKSLHSRICLKRREQHQAMVLFLCGKLRQAARREGFQVSDNIGEAVVPMCTLTSSSSAESLEYDVMVGGSPLKQHNSSNDACRSFFVVASDKPGHTTVVLVNPNTRDASAYQDLLIPPVMTQDQYKAYAAAFRKSGRGSLKFETTQQVSRALKLHPYKLPYSNDP